MRASRLVDRLGHYLRLTDDEHHAIARLEDQDRLVRRGTIIRREREPAADLVVVRSGWLYSAVLLDDGNRQIVRLHLPGDLVGLSAVACADAPEALVALTDARICTFDRAMLRQVFDEHPRLAALLLALSQLDHVAMVDRIASLGRTSARARIAALILDALARLRVLSPDHGAALDLPMTQEEIGDATGLTAVHVNRMMRALGEERLIARSGTRVEVLDEARLARIAHHTDRYARIETGWMPAPRS